MRSTDTPPPLREVVADICHGPNDLDGMGGAVARIFASAEFVEMQRRADFGYDGPRTVPADCTHYCEEGHFSGDDMAMVDGARVALQERVAALEAALVRYGEHRHECDLNKNPVGECSCGWSAIFLPIARAILNAASEGSGE